MPETRLWTAAYRGVLTSRAIVEGHLSAQGRLHVGAGLLYGLILGRDFLNEYVATVDLHVYLPRRRRIMTMKNSVRIYEEKNIHIDWRGGDA